MIKDKNNQRDLESGDNPEERKKMAGKLDKKQDRQASGQKDLESGDNPEERKKISGKKV